MSKGIYIHYPYCEKKCFYCDFYSVAGTDYSDMYINALIKEIEVRAVSQSPEAIETIFIGGGTPSLMPVKSLEKIIKAINKYFDLSSIKEFSIECNPNSAQIANFLDYRSLGINRISLGVQSFIDSELVFLQRIHSSAGAVKAVESAMNCFDSVNLDLIFAVPGQTEQTLKQSLEQAVNIGVQHIAAYSLIYEEGTPLFRDESLGKINKAGEELEADMFELTSNTLFNSGYSHYEVSNFAKDGHHCLHNLNYWRRKEYYGFGPSAHGFLNSIRYSNIRDIDKYIKMCSLKIEPEDFSESLSDSRVIEENIFLGLRAEGINKLKMKTSFDIDTSLVIGDFGKNLIANNLAEDNEICFKLTRTGLMLCDEITVKIMDLFDNYLKSRKQAE